MSWSTLYPGSSAGRYGAVRGSASQDSRRLRGMLTPRLSTILLLQLLFIGLSSQQRDPVKNFCRRFGHQTAVVDDKLFIDGGLVNWNPISSYPDNYTNTWLLYQDLTTVASSGMPQLQANLSKNASVPSVHGGALWADDVNKRLFLFGGEYYNEPPSHFDLFAYDVLEDHWDALGAPRADDVQRVSYGAGVSVSERGEGYYYGGWLSNASVPGWGDAPPVATSRLVKYNMDSGEWTNTTGPDDMRRAEGAMLFVPAGDGGLLIYLGGVTDLYQNGTAVGQRMEEIFIYDVLSGKWYRQEASGQVPEQRRRFCAGVTWPEDKSSYNIYLYGGAQPPLEEGAGFDDLYILSLPSFTWIKMYPNDRNGTGDYPHHSLSCNMAPGSAQMLIIGGHFPLMEDCDAPEQWGTHNADLGKQNEDKSPWALYEPNKTEYVVPDDVFKVIGGNGKGGATKKVPDDGFDHADIGVLMTRKASIAERTPTRDIKGGEGNSESSGLVLSTGAIIGIAVGGGVLLLAMLAACIFCLRRRRRRQQQIQAQQAHFPSPSHPYHHSMSEAGWSPAQTSALATSPSPYAQGLDRERAGSARTVPPYTGPPVELPSDGTTPLGSGQQHGYFADGTGTGSSGQRTVAASDDTGTPSRAASAKYDAHGNAWVPQVSMVQVSPGSGRQYTHHRSVSAQSPPMPPSPAYTGQHPHSPGRWSHHQRQPSPASTPRSELVPAATRDHRSFSELSADRGRPEDGSPRHETYYHP